MFTNVYTCAHVHMRPDCKRISLCVCKLMDTRVWLYVHMYDVFAWVFIHMDVAEYKCMCVCSCMVGASCARALCISSSACVRAFFGYIYIMYYGGTRDYI